MRTLFNYMFVLKDFFLNEGLGEVPLGKPACLPRLDINKRLQMEGITLYCKQPRKSVFSQGLWDKRGQTSNVLPRYTSGQSSAVPSASKDGTKGTRGPERREERWNKTWDKSQNTGFISAAPLRQFAAAAQGESTLVPRP